MNANLRMTLSRAIAESVVSGNDGFFAKCLVTDLLTDITMPHDTFAFDILHPDGITVIQVVATVTVTAPELTEDAPCAG